MTTRTLPVEEWPRLRGTEAEGLWPHLMPETATIIVVEDQGVIVGCQVLMYVLHAECLWVHEDYRSRGVLRLLWSTVKRMARAAGVRSIATAATSDVVQRLLTYLGAERLPGQHYVIAMKETPCQQR
jgi:GNAT superfamily N-acetyltransferase